LAAAKLKCCAFNLAGCAALATAPNNALKKLFRMVARFPSLRVSLLLGDLCQRCFARWGVPAARVGDCACGTVGSHACGTVGNHACGAGR